MVAPVADGDYLNKHWYFDMNKYLYPREVYVLLYALT